MLNQLDETLLIFAFRYALGRTSTAPSFVVDYLIDHWSNLSPFAQSQIKKELLFEIGRDDEARSEETSCPGCIDRSLPLGWDCDRATWDRLLQFINTQPSS